MPEESTTRDLVGLAHRAFDALDSGDFDAVMSIVAPYAVFDMSPVGVGSFEGHAAIRGFYEDWLGAYERSGSELEEVLDLGNGVTFLVASQTGRPEGARVRFRSASRRSTHG